MVRRRAASWESDGSAAGTRSSPPSSAGLTLRRGEHSLEPFLVDDLDTELLRLVELAAATGAGHQQVRLRAHRGRGLSAQRLHERLRLLATPVLELAGEHHGLPR